jgi:hypothetical protein
LRLASPLLDDQRFQVALMRVLRAPIVLATMASPSGVAHRRHCFNAALGVNYRSTAPLIWNSGNKTSRRPGHWHSSVIRRLFYYHRRLSRKRFSDPAELKYRATPIKSNVCSGLPVLTRLGASG